MNLHTLARVASCGLLATLSAGTLAANVTVTGWAFGSGGGVNLTFGNGGTYSGAAGGFTGSLVGTPGGQYNSNSFLTYCIELTEGFGFSNNPMTQYEVVDGSSYFGNRYHDAGRATALGNLLTYVAANPGQVDSAAESTAMQLAVWNLVYDNDYSVSGGSFKDTSVFATQANVLLAGAAGVTSSNFSIFALERAGTQDFLLGVLRSDAPSLVLRNVPEPAGLALVGVALLALAGARRAQRRPLPRP